MAVVCTAQRGIVVYKLENPPVEVKKIESPLKFQVKNNHFLPLSLS